MSLSILIPIYNFSVKNLVSDLYEQCKFLGLDFEIVLVDDFSEIEIHNENLILGNKLNVSYERLKKNIGRSKIRNYLVENAAFENCLILDCDVAIISEKFVKKYLENTKKGCVIVGGHSYSNLPPEDDSKMLHWKYGVNVECQSLKNRLKKPYDSFMTNSFLIQKSMFSKVSFDESIKYYGHEDTVFGIEMELQGIEIRHIDNPVLHLGLKSVDEFLKCEEAAIGNLLLLVENSKFKNEIINKSKLLKYEKSVFLNLYYSVLSFFCQDWLYQKLFNKNPTLSVLSFWKYNTLSEIRKRNL